MPAKSDNSKSRTVGARFSHEQVTAILRYLDGRERKSDYVRRLIIEDMAAHGATLPEHEFIPNEDRAEKGVPWRKKNNS